MMRVTALKDEGNSTMKITNDEGNSSKCTKTGALIHMVVGHGGGEVWAMAGVQGKVAFGLRHFCILSFSKRKFRPANSHEDPNLTMHWHRQIGNVAG